jgi:hypothetical protein
VAAWAWAWTGKMTCIRQHHDPKRRPNVVIMIVKPTAFAYTSFNVIKEHTYCFTTVIIYYYNIDRYDSILSHRGSTAKNVWGCCCRHALQS